jgi:hypothetical protein
VTASVQIARNVPNMVLIESFSFLMKTGLENRGRFSPRGAVNIPSVHVHAKIDYSSYIIFLGMNKHHRIVLLLLLIGTTGSGVAQSESGPSFRKPLDSRNQFPLTLLFLNMRPTRAGVPASTERSLLISMDYSNILVADKDDPEYLLLDSEYLRTEFRFDTGLGKGFAASVELPFYLIYGGFLDPLISNYHKAFGLPNGARDRTPENRLEYQYQVDGVDQLRLSGSASSVGDLTLHLKKLLMEGNGHGLAVRTAVKLPTGKRENFTGSGKTDLGIGVAWSRVGSRFGGYGNFSYHFLGKPEGISTKNYISGMGAFDWKFNHTLAAVIQYDYIQSFIDSRLETLDQGAHQIALGLRWRRSERFQFEWRFTEDITATAPDFTIGFSVAVGWKGGKVEDRSQNSRME